MQILKPNEVKSIEQFFQLKEERLLKVMSKFLMMKYKEVYTTNEYIIAIGDIPVAIVAHLDTVFSTPPNDIFYDRVKNVMWSPDGLGADDRAGVYSIVQIVKQGYKPTIIFTTDEEIGGRGANALIKEFPNAPTHLKYIIELDRQGADDCVFYDCDNPDFEDYVESFGFVTASGTFSDISIICPNWKIAGVNLSIGYRDEHTYGEILYIGHMLNTINKVIKMLKQASSNTVKDFEYIPIVYNSLFFKNHPEYAYLYMHGWGEENGFNTEDIVKIEQCHICGQKDLDYNLFPTKGLNNESVFICSDCVANTETIGWCKTCFEPFLLIDPKEDNNYCRDCRERVKVNAGQRDKG